MPRITSLAPPLLSTRLYQAKKERCQVMYLCVRGINLADFYDFFLLDFRNVPTVSNDFFFLLRFFNILHFGRWLYFLTLAECGNHFIINLRSYSEPFIILYCMLEMFRQCGIFPHVFVALKQVFFCIGYFALCNLAEDFMF